MGDWGYFVVLIVTVGVAILGTYGATKDYYYRKGRMTLEELKEKINQFIQLNKELKKAVGVYMCTDSRGFIQADAVAIAKYAKENGLEIEIKPWNSEKFPWMITVPEIKLYGVASDEEVQEIKAMLEKKRHIDAKI
jgi:hypothetical protein